MSTKNEKSEEVEAYGNKWRKVNPATSQAIKKIEANLKVSMPQNLKTFLKNCAGGYPNKNFYQDYDNDIEVSIGYVLPVNHGEKRNELIKVHAQLCNIFDFPDDLIPFAVDNGNANHLCLNTNTGEIVYWLHDDPSDRMRKVSNSLEEFLSKLEEPPF